MPSELPAMPSTLSGAIGRPFWYEGRAPFERSRLEFTRVPLEERPGARVVFVTGYLAGRSSARRIVDWLRRAGYRVDLADVGRNMVSSGAAVDRITEALEDSEEPSILIGHSRGGQQCRVAAYRNPNLVSQLITLGSPVRAHRPRSAPLRASVEGLRLLGRLPVGPSENPESEKAYERDLFAPFDVGVPWAVIYSKTDGVIEWQACLDLEADWIEVDCSHVGLVASVSSCEAIASVLDNLPT